MSVITSPEVFGVRVVNGASYWLGYWVYAILRELAGLPPAFFRASAGLSVLLVFSFIGLALCFRLGLLELNRRADKAMRRQPESASTVRLTMQTLLLVACLLVFGTYSFLFTF